MHVDLYERVWMYLTVGLLVLFMGAIAFSVSATGLALPGHVQSVDPLTVAEEPPFDNPGIFETAANKYDVYMVARTWNFTPLEINVPSGSEVTFYITSVDVIHGFKINGTSANGMIIPGQVTRLKVNFDEPGEYLFVCHEYCGAGHHIMSGTVIVE